MTFTIKYDETSDMGKDLRAVVESDNYYVIITDNFEAKNAVRMLRQNPDDLNTVIIESHNLGD